jgi:hypothetical protein
MRITGTALSLLRDMSAAQAECNSALQALDAAVHKTPFGAGRRRAQSAARRLELDPDREEARMIAEMNGYLENIG